MRDLWKTILILSVFCAICVKTSVIQLEDLDNGEDFNGIASDNPSEDVRRGDFNDLVFDDPDDVRMIELKGSVYKNVKRYHCELDPAVLSGLEPYKILYATNEWRFPRQDVNLTLAFPTSNNKSEYVITFTELFLFYDGSSNCHGYLTSGGVGRDSISLTFILPRISRLYYQFRLLGVEKNLFDRVAVFSNSTLLC